MIDVRVVPVQFCSQALRLFFFKEPGAGSNLPADCGFPMDSVRFHTTLVWDELFARIDYSFFGRDGHDLIRQESEADVLQPRSRFAVPPGTATGSIIHAAH